MAISDPWAKGGKLNDPCALSSHPTVTPLSYSGFVADDAAAWGEKQDIDKIPWVRANDLNNDTKFVVDGTNRNDVILDTLGNCWFLFALRSRALGQPHHCEGRGAGIGLFW